MPITIWLVAFKFDTLAQDPPSPSDWLLAAAVLVSAIVLTVAWFRALGTPRRLESQQRVREAEQGLEEALRGSAATLPRPGQGVDIPSPRELTDADQRQARLTLSELWVVTHRRLDHYHGIALGQAKHSFVSAQIAMAVGFILLIAFVGIALNASSATGSIVAGGLGAVAAALSAYVSRTFIRSQEAAAGHLRAYFDQPLEFSRYLAAERLVADAGLSEERRAEVLSTIVQAMISGPPGPASGETQEQQSDSRR
ncbi:hypothetical protein [Streptomyces sp. NPDC058202]|uniref:TRADD-N-associated membrane domain-containing protein n=1 Tax=Streptomyces sp. NPDC058202 TaxID=3346380 RepID=UPI0036E22D99